jgi:hypothetical protein
MVKRWLQRLMCTIFGHHVGYIHETPFGTVYECDRCWAHGQSYEHMHNGDSEIYWLSDNGSVV